MTPKIETWPGSVRVSRLRDCPLNPRTHYDDARLHELAASMTEHGCLQPLVVRPVPATAVPGDDRQWAGAKHFEVIAGHRRLRAAKLARFDLLPVNIRRLSDTDAKAIMLVENINREDLRPSEEAVSLADLVATLGLEKAAEKVGKPESYVRERAAMAVLPAWFLAAVDRQEVPVSTAAVVAKVPGEESRELAAACVLTHRIDPAYLDPSWRERVLHAAPEADAIQVLTYRDAKSLVRDHFCRELKGAPFARKALDLVPEAGSCDACPKRAGNDPELLADGVRQDVCTDPDCYARKVEAYRAAECERFRKKWEIAGPITPVEEPFRGDRAPRGYCDLGERINGSELGDDWAGDRTVQEVLAASGNAVGLTRLLAFDAKGKPRTLVRTGDVKKRLQHAGLMARPVKEKRVPLGDEEVSLRPAKKAGPKVKYGLLLNPDVMPTVEFEAPEGADVEELRERAAIAFMNWFDGVDWTDAKIVPRPFITFAPVVVPDQTPAPTEAAPPVHEPGNLSLSKLPGLNPSDVQCLLACGFATLGDLGRKCDGDLDKVEDVLGEFQGAFRPADVERVAGAVRRYLDANPDPVRTSAPEAKKPAKKSKAMA